MTVAPPGAATSERPLPAPDPTRQTRPAPALVPLAWATAIVAAGAAALGATYPGFLVALALAGLCVVIGALSAGAAFLRWPRSVVPVTVVAATLAVGVVGMLRAPQVGPDARLATPAWQLLLDAVPRLLTTPPGTPVRLDLVVPALLAVVTASCIAATRTLVRGPDRPVGLAPAVCAAALYGCALVVTAGRFDREGVVAAALALLCLAAWTRASRVAAGALIACAACATIVAAVAFPPGRDVRAVITPPTVAVAQPNLLPYLQLWGEQTDMRLFTVSGQVPDRIAIAIYTGYDGTSWSSGTQFTLFGSKPADTLPMAPLFADYRMQVQPGALPTDWLPAAGTVEAISLPDAVQDATGGSLLRIGQEKAPEGYTVSGRIGVADDAALPTASVPDSGSSGAYLQIPPLPAAVASWVDARIRPFPGRFQQAAALEADLREGRVFDRTGPGSSSLAAIADLLHDPAARAPAEQYASAFAVLARSLGLPTRLVVGVRMSQHPGVTAMSDVPVLSGQVTVWPEVYFSQVGWVPFDPVPGSDTPQQREHAQIRDAGSAALPDFTLPGGHSTPREQAAPPAPGAGPGLATAGGLGAGGLVLALLLASAIAGAARLRRLSRRGPPGHWSTVETAAALAGMRVDSAWTAEELATRIGERAGPDAARAAHAVATAAQASRFGPAPGSADPPPFPGDTAAAARLVRGALRRSGGRIRRWTWPVRPSGWRRPRRRDVPPPAR